MVSCSQICGVILSTLFEYDTAKIVHIKSKRVGLINRFIQLVIVVYVIGYVIVYKKGYQEFQEPFSSVTTKVKGVSLTNLSQQLALYGGVHVWDSADYVIPPEEDKAVFVMTNMIISPNQTQSACAEDPKFLNVNCTRDSDCPRLEPVTNGHGFRTGRCVPVKGKKDKKVCEIYAWCPVEIDELPMPGYNLRKNIPLLDAAKNFTLLVKNNVQFPKFGESLRNIKTTSNSSYLKGCTYDPDTAPLCPIFKLGKILELANVSFEEIAFQGGVMAIVITWNCNFDPLLYSCGPEYSFRRLDDSDAPIAPGYNFRFAKYYVQDNVLHRILIKAYGVRFVILVYGQGGKFSPIPLFLNLGSGLALLGIATVLCDIVVLYVLQKKYFYREKKYLLVDDVESNSHTDYQTCLIVHSLGQTNLRGNAYTGVCDKLLQHQHLEMVLSPNDEEVVPYFRPKRLKHLSACRSTALIRRVTQKTNKYFPTRKNSRGLHNANSMDSGRYSTLQNEDHYEDTTQGNG